MGILSRLRLRTRTACSDEFFMTGRTSEADDLAGSEVSGHRPRRNRKTLSDAAAMPRDPCRRRPRKRARRRLKSRRKTLRAGESMSEIGLFEAIHTARALRRLKPEPVPEALITQYSTRRSARPRPAMRRIGLSSWPATPKCGAGSARFTPRRRRSPKRCMPRAASPRTSPSANTGV